MVLSLIVSVFRNLMPADPLTECGLCSMTIVTVATFFSVNVRFKSLLIIIVGTLQDPVFDNFDDYAMQRALLLAFIIARREHRLGSVTVHSPEYPGVNQYHRKQL